MRTFSRARVLTGFRAYGVYGFTGTYGLPGLRGLRVYGYLRASGHDLAGNKNELLRGVRVYGYLRASGLTGFTGLRVLTGFRARPGK